MTRMVIRNEDLEGRAAKFATRQEADEAARKAMPRRRHNRPHAVYTAAYGAWVVIVGNTIMLDDGTMWDHMRQRAIRP